MFSCVINLIDDIIYKWYRAVARNGHSGPSREHVFANYCARKFYVVFHILSIHLQIAYLIILLSSRHNWQVFAPILCCITYLLTYLGLFLQKRLLLLPHILSDSIIPLHYFSMMGRYSIKQHDFTLHMVMGGLIVLSGVFQWLFLLVILRDYCRVEKENEQDDRDCFWEIGQVYLIMFLFPLFIYVRYHRHDEKPKGGIFGFIRKYTLEPRGRARSRNREESDRCYTCSVISRFQANSISIPQ
ncbi:unnamed protein product [Bursaphelenchus okinawaensis]|uniref:Uncharacterized protein n=1 Tax=Bursaphelenchus okinawaensis TaxID=465554 RepID=A0A811JRF6_9BILA|nr:unnamed protein product [Bursaphelenchus okinawaensis]CAG9079557.1 unnamed protein product [Bursaphelenchus okinawaensis]